MKKILVTVLMLGSVLLTQAQDLRKGVWGLSLSIEGSGIVQPPVMGGPEYRTLPGYETGFDYLYRVTNRFSLESGVIFHTNQFKIIPAFYPGIDRTPEYSTFTMAYIPLDGKLMCSRSFYINGGLLLDVDLSSKSKIDHQTGIGTNFGLGIEIPVFKTHKIDINPFFNFHGLRKFESNRDSQWILSSGIHLILR